MTIAAQLAQLDRPRLAITCPHDVCTGARVGDVWVRNLTRPFHAKALDRGGVMVFDSPFRAARAVLTAHEARRHPNLDRAAGLASTRRALDVARDVLVLPADEHEVALGECGVCQAPLLMIDGHWTDEDGGWWCGDNRTYCDRLCRRPVDGDPISLYPCSRCEGLGEVLEPHDPIVRQDWSDQ